MVAEIWGGIKKKKRLRNCWIKKVISVLNSNLN